MDRKISEASANEERNAELFEDILLALFKADADTLCLLARVTSLSERKLIKAAKLARKLADGLEQLATA